MLLRTRPLIRTAILIVVGLLLAYFLFAWWGFEPLVKWAAPKFVADKTGHRLTIATARFDPLRLSVDLGGVALAEPGGKPMLSLGRLFVDLDATGVFKRAYVFDEVRLSAPVVQVELRADGRLNWLDFVEALAAGAKPSAPTDGAPTRLLVRRAVLEQGHVHLIDRKVVEGFETAVEPLELALDNLSTLPEDRGAYSLSAKTAIGATVRWKGDLSLNPLTATGEVAVNDVFLARLWPYLKNALNMAPPEGTVATSLTYRASYATASSTCSSTRSTPASPSSRCAVRKTPRRAIALNAIRVSGGRVDLAKQEVSMAGLTVDGGRVAIELDARGRPQLLDC